MRRWIAALLFVAVPAAAQRTTPASQEELDAITTRGVRLAIYDRVAWIATDSVLALHPDQSRIQMYIAHPDPATGRFVVLFGRLNAARDTFLVAYRVIEHEQPGIYSTVTVDPSAPAVEQETAMARALDLARRDFGVPQRPYNIAVLATEGGVWSVYAIPAPTSRSPYPLGGDIRWTISSDGLRILEKRQLHKSVLEFGPPPNTAGGKKPVEDFHVAVVDNLPEDTDVFFTITRQPLVAHLVLTKDFVYRIDTNGSIRYLGKAADLLHK